MTTTALATGARETERRPATAVRAVPLAVTLAAVVAVIAGIEAMLSGSVSATSVAGALGAA
ncbi:MAG TPA: hypothetical protein VF112_07145, partial [Candidatus Dormibacteraeota bacterium]